MPARFGPSLVCLALLAVVAGACDDQSSASSVDDAEGTPASAVEHGPSGLARAVAAVETASNGMARRDARVDANEAAVE